MSIKEQIINLVDGVEDEGVLEQIYEVMYSITQMENGEIWSYLSEGQKEKVYRSYEQSKDPSKQISHNEAKKRLSKWF